MTQIILEDITKTIGGKVILQDINLRINSGDVAVLLGPSGAGKTTLLRIIAGTEKPNKGKIYFDGVDVTNLPPQKRNIGMVFQTFALYPHLTIYENIASPLRIKKMRKEEISETVEKTAQLLNIKHILSRRPSECSGGEAQRAAIARALVKRPRICLFDEPLTNLDYKVRETLRVELKRIFAEINTTIIYSTSNPEEATALGKTLIHIRDGRIMQSGDIKECLKRPVDIKAFSFYSIVGVNVLEAKCVVEGLKKFLYVNEHFKIDVNETITLKEGEGYLIGIYPHSIKLLYDEMKSSCESHASEIVRLPINVDIVENRGSELLVTAKCKDMTLKILTFEIQKLDKIKSINEAIIPTTDIMIFDRDGNYIGRVMS